MRDPLDHPNIVVFLADDMGWGDIGIHGNPNVETPNLDGLAKSGARLERFYVSPASAPSRATILTGRHCLLTGVTADSWGANVLHENELTFGEVLRDAGYQTGYFGHWQNGVNSPHDPVSQGFQIFGEVDGFAKFLHEAAGEPFCAVIAPQVSPPKQLGDVHREIERVDGLVGDVLAQIEALKLSKHSLVLFLSDCGPVAVEGRFNAKLYGTKGSLHEGGVRVPCIWHWPGVIPNGQVVNNICHHTDIFSTLMEFAGAMPPTDRRIDGINLAPLLLFGGDERWPNRNLNSVWVPGRDLDRARKSYRTTRWVAVKDPDWRRMRVRPTDEQWELYDLLADPHQHYNVEEAYTFVLAGLKSDIMHWFHRSQVYGYPVIPTRLESGSVRLLAEAALFPEGWKYPGEITVLDSWNESGFETRWLLQTNQPCRVQINLIYKQETGRAEMIYSAGERSSGFSLETNAEWNRVNLGIADFGLGQSEFSIRNVNPAGDLEIREVNLKVVDSH